MLDQNEAVLQTTGFFILLTIYPTPHTLGWNHAQEYQEVDATEKSFKYYSVWLKNRQKNKKADEQETPKQSAKGEKKKEKKREKTLRVV